MSKYQQWRKGHLLGETPVSTTGQFVVVTQYAPGPTTLQSQECFYQDGSFYNSATNEPITAPIIMWAPLPTGQ